MSVRDAGFTLLEMLVAAALMALIAVTAAGGLRFGARVWERAADAGEAATEDRALRRFLRETLTGLAPVRPRDGSREPALLLEGRPDRLLAAASLPGALSPPGPQWAALAFERRGDGIALTLRWEALGPTPPDASGPSAAAVTLAEGLDGGRFIYHGPDGPRDAWSGPDAPRLIEVALGAGAPPLAVRPMLLAAP
jgi:prepilin-type N-terminal cleavage/methylation domain-containing protein